MRQNHLQALLGQLASAARALSKQECADLLAGRSRLVFHLIAVKTPKKNTRRVSGDDLQEKPVFRDAAEKLRGMPTREAGAHYLRTMFNTKDDLLKLARSLDIPVRERDARSKMEDKIVNATIGFRLRSEAVRRKSDHD